MKIKIFTFNSFQENTLIVYDDTKECIIIDPGCYTETEKETLTSFIYQNQLNPTKLINTHCHIDHILGNEFVMKKFGLDLEIHKEELFILQNSLEIAKMYGFFEYIQPTKPPSFIREGDKISFGDSRLNVLFTPGHSPGHISLLNKKQNILISGDVVFQGSIGRTDLPNGDYNQLIKSIKQKILPLADKLQIYPGHGPVTNLSFEKKHNPFLQ
ncbi:MAG: MBL fold metallo-hydrolase [Bacteroidota bacterium]|nr:MBL fold metallo-hydrolase [Bacteroidota bacterium]